MNPQTSSKLLTLALWAGVAYFCAMATAHFFGLKVPLLFVYYDVPYHAYQDKIISFAVVAYVCLFASAARIPEVVPAALVALGVLLPLFGLSVLVVLLLDHLVVRRVPALAGWFDTA